MFDLLIVPSPFIFFMHQLQHVVNDFVLLISPAILLACCYINYKKVLIVLHVVPFWPEIKLLITNVSPPNFISLDAITLLKMPKLHDVNKRYVVCRISNICWSSLLKKEIII